MRMLLVLLPLLSCKSETQAFTEDASEVICSCISDRDARKTCETEKRSVIARSLLSCDYDSSALDDCLYSLEQAAEAAIPYSGGEESCWENLYGPVPGSGAIEGYCPGTCDF